MTMTKQVLTIREQIERLVWAAELNDRKHSKSAHCRGDNQRQVPKGVEGGRVA